MFGVSELIGLTGPASARYRRLVIITLTDHLLWFTWSYQITFSESLTHGRCLPSTPLVLSGMAGTLHLLCFTWNYQIIFSHRSEHCNHLSTAHF
jgi:hypothetical protein